MEVEGTAANDQEDEEEDEEAVLLLEDDGVEETEAGLAMHPKAEELLKAHLAKADFAGYQRMQAR